MARPCRSGVNVRFEPSSPGLLIQFWLKLVKEVILLNNLEDQQGKVVGYIVVAVPVHIRYNGIQYLAGRSRSVFEDRLLKALHTRSEERRVGKESRFRRTTDGQSKTQTSTRTCGNRA